MFGRRIRRSSEFSVRFLFQDLYDLRCRPFNGHCTLNNEYLRYFLITRKQKTTIILQTIILGDKRNSYEDIKGNYSNYFMMK